MTMSAYTEYGAPGTVQRRRYMAAAQARCRARRRGELPPFQRFVDDLDSNGIWTGDPADPSSCFVWKRRACLANGRGRVWRNGKAEIVSRVSLEEKLQRPLLPGMVARHTCDNPPCFRKAHLYEGTQQENVEDMVSRGRAWWQTRKLEAA